jgi:hypothetical protein
MSSSSPAGSQQTPETPGLAEILGYFAGTIDMMRGRAEGLRRLDLTADGFWTSFLSLAVALPPMALSWVEYEDVQRDGPVAGPIVVYGAHAAADLVAWILPVVLLMVLAKWIGLNRKILPLVVATNWGNALLAWAMVPIELLVIATHGATAVVFLAVAASVVALVLMVRLIATALGQDVKAAVGIALLIVLTSIFSYGVMTDVTGISLI